MSRLTLGGLAVCAAVLVGCTHDLDLRQLETQRLPVAAGPEPITLRAVHGGLVNMTDQNTWRVLYNGFVTVGDDVTLDAAAHTVKVRGLVTSDDLRPGDVVQVTFN